MSNIIDTFIDKPNTKPKPANDKIGRALINLYSDINIHKLKNADPKKNITKKDLNNSFKSIINLIHNRRLMIIISKIIHYSPIEFLSSVLNIIFNERIIWLTSLINLIILVAYLLIISIKVINVNITLILFMFVFSLFISTTINVFANKSK